MNSYILDTNNTIKSKDDLLVSIAKATVASFKLEGITLTYEEAYQLAFNSAEKRLKTNPI